MDWTKLRLEGLQQIDLPVVGALPSDMFIFKGADGLDPTEVAVSISSTLFQGGVYGGRRPQNKQVVVRMGLNPDYSTGQTPSDLRKYVYGLLTPSFIDYVMLYIMDDADVVCQIKGWVSRVEAAIFDANPGVQITIECLEPYLSAPAEIFPDVSTLNTGLPHIANIGDAPSGFRTAISFTADISSWSISKFGDSTKKMQIDFEFLEDDELFINTIPGQKSMVVHRGDLESPIGDINMLPYFSSDSVWFQLYGGDNYWLSSDDFHWDEFVYTPQFWGI